MTKKSLFTLITLTCLLGMTAFPESVNADRFVVQIDTNYGDIIVELFDDLAPNTVQNFLKYIDDGFYSNKDMIFHRVDKTLTIIQGGAYDSNLYQADFNAPGFSTIDPAFYHDATYPDIDLETDAGLLNKRGTIAMARSSSPDSANSQFYINAVDNPGFDPVGSSDGYAVFGVVTDGMDVVDNIIADPVSQVHASFQSLPDTPVIIEQISFDREFGTGSSDFSDVSFINTTDGTERNYTGLGTYA